MGNAHRLLAAHPRIDDRETEVDVPSKRFDIQVTGRLPAGVLDEFRYDGGGTRMRTVLRGPVPDQAALHGLLRHLNALGLDVVELRQLQSAVLSEPRTGAGEHRSGTSPLVVEILIEGPIGDLAVSSLAEHGDVAQTATRLSIPDPHILGEVLVRLAEAGAQVEYVTDLSASG